MHRILVAGLAASLGLAGWSSLAGAELFSRTGPVIAIMADDLFLGEAKGHLSGAGTIAIHSQEHPDVTCSGQFTSSAEHGGLGQLRCSNGATGTYRFKRMSLEKGYGTGSYGRGLMSFAYGLSVDEAEPYLKLPTGKKLMNNGTTLELVDADKVRKGATKDPAKSLLDKNSPGEPGPQAFTRWFAERYQAVLAFVRDALKGD